MDHCYIICIPEAIFDIWGFVRPLVFEDIMKISDVWRNWRNPDPIILVAPADQTQELKMKIVITNPELCLLEDPKIPETKAIVIVRERTGSKLLGRTELTTQLARTSDRPSTSSFNETTGRRSVAGAL